MTAFSRLLENPGFSVVESDPGEYIQQLKGEPPYHFVFPCMHLAYGVGTIPVSAIFNVRDRLVDALRRSDAGPKKPIWIGSASHCHGLAAAVTVSR